MPSWQDVQAFCLAFPDAFLDHPWGDVVFKVGKKIFVFASGDTAPLAVTVKIPEALRETWLNGSYTFVPSYVGRYGWIGIRVVDEASWDMAQRGIEWSFSRVAGSQRISRWKSLSQ